MMEPTPRWYRPILWQSEHPLTRVGAGGIRSGSDPLQAHAGGLDPEQIRDGGAEQRSADQDEREVSGSDIRRQNGKQKSGCDGADLRKGRRE